MLIQTFAPKRKVLDKKYELEVVGRPLRIKMPNIAYLPPLERGSYPNETPIHNYTKYKTSQEFKVTLNCYLSKHPHLSFVTFHKYGDSPTQILFIDNSRKCQVAILVSEFREYCPSKVGGYTDTHISEYQKDYESQFK